MSHLLRRHGPRNGWLRGLGPRSAHRAVLTLPYALSSGDAAQNGLECKLTNPSARQR